jgi:hypothetical protein
MHIRPVFLLLVLLLAAFTVGAVYGQADEPNLAGLVVLSGEGQSATYCVPFPEAEISGYELLRRTGLELELGSSVQGVAVCSVDGTGCPAGDCFCQCRGEPCQYWSYWQLGDSGWEYAVRGANQIMVRPGDVHGWTWGPGTVSEALQPPPATFADICADGPTVAALPAEPVAEPAGVLPGGGRELALLGLMLFILLAVLFLVYRNRRRPAQPPEGTL